MDHKATRDFLFLMRSSVARGEDSIARQKQWIAELGRAGKDTGKAQRLLSSIEETHRRNIELRDSLEIKMTFEPAPA
jgi:hypothetical protein